MEATTTIIIMETTALEAALHLLTVNGGSVSVTEDFTRDLVSVH